MPPLSNAKLFVSLLAQNFSVASPRRGYAAATATVTASQRRGNRKASKGDVGSSAENSWIPDPVTGYYKPANRAEENDEKELEAATEKLAACQETIFLLGKQLNSMRPQPEFMNSPNGESSLMRDGVTEDEATTSDRDMQDMDRVKMDTTPSPTHERSSSYSPLNIYNAPFSPSHNEVNVPRSPISSKNPRHRPSKSGSSTVSTPTPEKHSRGFSRFFSSKGKNGH